MDLAIRFRAVLSPVFPGSDLATIRHFHSAFQPITGESIMKMSQAFLFCVCLLGATQFAWSQTKGATIPGFYNPTTREFTTRSASSAPAKPDTQTALAGSGVFFREQFNITIANYDQPSSDQAACSVSMDSYGDSNGASYHETASVPATSNGSGWTCEVPVLTLWTLESPTTDSISVTVDVYIYAPNQTAVDELLPNLRESEQSLTLSQPGNTQTVVNTLTFQL